MAETREPPTPPKDREPPRPSALEELVDRWRQWFDAWVHPPVLVPVPVRRRR